MDELFGNNLSILFIVASIAVISYSNFQDNQRMFLLYLLSYGTSYFSVFDIYKSMTLLLITTFVFLEYLTEDRRKIEIIVRFDYKITDYIFMMLLQYHFISITLAFLTLYWGFDENFSKVKELLILLSFAFLIYGEHRTISQPFKIKSVTEIMKIFDSNPVYAFRYNEKMQSRFDLLCAMEDKSYFHRKKSYSCLSLEYFIFIFRRHGLKSIPKIIHNLPTLHRKAAGIQLVGRGFSTLEMQLLRTLGIVRGYEKYKLSRKIFEIIYSKILFSSIKRYHQANTYLELTYYRHYLLYIYFQVVLTKIHDVRYIPLSSTFVSPDKEASVDIANWSLNGLFIACLGLSFREVSDKT